MRNYGRPVSDSMRNGRRGWSMWQLKASNGQKISEGTTDPCEFL